MSRFLPGSHRLVHACSLALGAACPPLAALAQSGDPARDTGVVVITGQQPSSLPTRIPTTLESITGAQIEQAINASDSEDALKYLPSLLVRKRYIGDYNHAVLSTRASGTGNSARSLVYADGVLLSNLLGNGAAFTPRWAMVTPEEIDRVDVLYGPFSAAYPGNAVGAVVDYVTRQPQRFEAHLKLGLSSQANDLYGHGGSFNAGQASASLGDRAGPLSWWVNVNHTDSHGQPLVFATRLVSSGTALQGNETVVNGAVAGLNPRQQAWWLLGSSTEYRTVQDHAKAKLAWDISANLRAHLLLGYWRNRADGQSTSWLRGADGAELRNTAGGDISQAVAIDGKRYTLAATDFSQTRDTLDHVMGAVSLQSRRSGALTWALAASQYGYQADQARAYAPTSKSQPLAGRLTDGAGTGWQTLSAKATLRQDAHTVDAGLGQDSYRLRSQVHTTAVWQTGEPQAFVSRFAGEIRTRSAFVQDSWQFAPDWATVLGLRAEQWTAHGGVTESAFTGSADKGVCNSLGRVCTLAHPVRKATHYSPKAALSHALSDAWVIKASTGRAIRFPTVSELYQGGVNALGQAINHNPDLRPERSQTSELSAEWQVPGARLRSTLFFEDSRDALYAQLNTATNANNVQNIAHVRTSGLELAGQAAGDWTAWLAKGLQLQASLTYADSRILANEGYLLVPGDTLGKWQPRVPRWRASALGTWQATRLLSLSYGARFSGTQFSALDNGDTNGMAYTGASRYFTTDLRLLYRIDRQWSAALGVDNLNKRSYWNFHPYPQRSVNAELRFDL